MDQQTAESLKAQFDRDGFAIIRNFFDQDTVDEICERAEHILEKQNQKARKDQFSNVTKGLDRVDDYFKNLLHDGPQVAILEMLMGRKPEPTTASFFTKDKHSQEVHPHSDAMEGGVIWVAIDPADKENGCLSVIPGSHLAKTHYEHTTRSEQNLVLNQGINDEHVLSTPPAHVELKAGQMSLHDIYLVHGSAPNTSGRRRAGLTVRFMPSSSWFRRDMPMPFSGYPVDFANRPIWLVKGKDVCGKNNFEIGKDSAVDAA